MSVLWNLQDVRVSGRLAVDSLAIASGRTAIIGPSGAGKSTLLEVLVGFLPGAAAQQATQRPALAWACERTLWSGATVREQVGADAATWLVRFGLERVADVAAERLSAGERDRLALAVALAARPGVVVADEPLARCDPALAAELWPALIGWLAEAGASLVYATHAPERVVGWADAAVCLADGAVAWAGPVDDLLHRPPTAALAAYLGPATWIGDDAARRLGVAAGCVRPERLRLEPQGDGPARVTASRYQGAVTRTELAIDGAAALTAWHRPAAALAPGTRVRLTVVGA